MNTKSLLSGKERLFYLPILGREIRVGSPSELSVSDFDRLRRALRSRNISGALSYLTYIHNQWLGMGVSYWEWIWAWFDFITERRGQDASILTGKAAYANWRQGIKESLTNIDDEAVTLLFDLLHRGLDAQYLAGSVSNLASLRKPLGERLNKVPINTYGRIVETIRRRRFAKGLRGLDCYADQIRQRHDLLAAFIWAYASVVDKLYGQVTSQEGLIWSLSRCSFFDPWWRLATTRRPEEVALLMAEELRGHFSGPLRFGSVKLVDNPDYYLLVFDPCGSGGALRRLFEVNSSDGFGTFKHSTPATWNRNGDVPIYCAHCAQNELTSIDRLGYPVWVTDFDPDPNRPCGWRIYKDPALIPARYYSRLGIDRDDHEHPRRSTCSEEATKEAH